MNTYIVVFCCIIICSYVQTAFSVSNDFYTAAVVEYQPITDENWSFEEHLNANVEGYGKLLNSVEGNLDLVVYPESTLTFGVRVKTHNDYLSLSTQVPAAEDVAAPCDDTDNIYPNFFKKLSCMAKQRQVYIVVNIMEKKKCEDEENCSSCGYNLYNTDVAFNRYGVVIAKYRKYNLFGEYHLNKTIEPEVVTFNTDFNQTFGMFTCFDLQFEKPALELVRRGVKNIIFPTYWFSELPFLTALQAQQSFAQENNVTFLSAGGNFPKLGSGGSGIFVAGQPVIYDIIAKGGSNIYVAKIEDTNQYTKLETNDDQASDMDAFYLKRDQIDVYSSIYLNTNLGDVLEETVCHNNDNFTICCQFTINIHQDWSNPKNLTDYYRYRLVAYSGVRSYTGVYNGGVEHCGIIACLNDTLQSCALRFKKHSEIFWPITFTTIEIKANYTNTTDKNQTPTSLLSNIRPIHPVDTSWTSKFYIETGLVERIYKLLTPQNRLLTFGIHGRDFSRDSDPRGGAATTHNTLLTSIIAIMLLAFVLN